MPASTRVEHNSGDERPDGYGEENVLVDNGLELLDEHECLRLLRSRTVGRVGVNMGALPAIFPVNYRVIGDAIYFRTAEGAKLSAALSHNVVAFETDDLDPERRGGWSVQVIGRARQVTSSTIAAVVKPWVDGERDNLIQVQLDMLTGRRIRHGISAD